MEAYMRNNVILTAILCFSYFTYGLGANIISAALLDIVELTDSSVEELSQWSFVIASISYCSSAILGGYFGRKINRHLYCTVCMFLSGVSRIAVPISRSVVHYSLAMVITGVANGGIDVGVNSWLLDMWHGEQCNMYMQTLHFSYALGSLISPFIAEPFLSRRTNESITLFNETLGHNVTDFKITKYESGILYPYSLCFILHMVCVAILLFLYFYLPKQSKSSSSVQNSQTELLCDTKEQENSQYSKSMKITILIVAGIVLSCESGMEANIFSYIQQFAKGHGYDKTKGAFVLSALTASFTASRGISAIAAIKIPIKYILITSLTFLAISTAILQLLVDRELFLWVGFCAMGIGFGPFYAGVFSLIEKDIRITTNICGVFVMMASLASIINDFTTGKLIETYLISYLIYNWAALIIAAVLFIVLNILLTKKLPKPKMDSNSNVI